MKNVNIQLLFQLQLQLNIGIYNEPTIGQAAYPKKSKGSASLFKHHGYARIQAKCQNPNPTHAMQYVKTTL